MCEIDAVWFQHNFCFIFFSGNILLSRLGMGWYEKYVHREVASAKPY